MHHGVCHEEQQAESAGDHDEDVADGDGIGEPERCVGARAPAFCRSIGALEPRETASKLVVEAIL